MCKKIVNCILSALLALLCGASVWAVRTAQWEARHWDNLTMYEAVNQLATPVGGTGSEIIEDFVYGCVRPALLTVPAVGLLLFLLRRWRGFDRLVRAGTACALAFVLGMLAYGWELLGVEDYLRDADTESDYIEQRYVDPRQVALTFPERKRNLIYIWLESMESTFADKEHGGAFEENVIEELTRLAAEGDSFTGTAGGVNGACSPTGMSWTMGALFAQTAGLPLKIPLSESSMDSQANFFPGVVTLGDILAENGYRQAFLLGSDATFAGRDRYFAEHGGAEIWDYTHSIESGELPEDYYVWWGYEDEKLFSFAREHLRTLAAGSEPFCLSMLTVDTHFPDGWVCPRCREDFEDQYSNVIACSSRQVFRFVRWLQRQDFWDDTTVVITGDHITMNAGYCDGIEADYPRRTYTVILNAAAEEREPERYRSYTSMDLFPTTLSALGVDIRGGRLGLGVDLYAGWDTLLERDGYAELDAQLRRGSSFMDKLTGLGADTLATTALLRTLDTGLSAEWVPQGLSVSLDIPLELKLRSTGVLVFAVTEHNGQKETLAMSNARSSSEGGYTVVLPRAPLSGHFRYTLELYADTPHGRLPLDSGYAVDVLKGTVTRNNP